MAVFIPLGVALILCLLLIGQNVHLNRKLKTLEVPKEPKPPSEFKYTYTIKVREIQDRRVVLWLTHNAKDATMPEWMAGAVRDFYDKGETESHSYLQIEYPSGAYVTRRELVGAVQVLVEPYEEKDDDE